jgi:ubiquinone/menaquinone biosynthesis C-methylase UbiE
MPVGRSPKPQRSRVPAGFRFEVGVSSVLDLRCSSNQVMTRVIDRPADTLDYARRRVPEAEFRVGELDRRPLADDSVGVVVCALALVHVARLRPVLAEFTRVLRPGGDLIISEVRHELVTRGLGDHGTRPDGRALTPVGTCQVLRNRRR